MPTYTFKRTTDGTLTKAKLTFAEYDSLRAGDLKLADEEGVELELVFDPKGATFVLKDGVSGGWASKAMRENKHRQERRAVMAQREKDHVFKTRLIPNYKGQEAVTWKEVQDEVRTQKGAAAAATYNAHVAKESKKR